MITDPEELLAMLIPYVCEHTGLSRHDVEAVLDAQEAFWNSRSRSTIFFFFGPDPETGRDP